MAIETMNSKDLTCYPVLEVIDSKLILKFCYEVLALA